jgi:hypothetical protein
MRPQCPQFNPAHGWLNSFRINEIALPNTEQKLLSKGRRSIFPGELPPYQIRPEHGPAYFESEQPAFRAAQVVHVFVGASFQSDVASLNPSATNR